MAEKLSEIYTESEIQEMEEGLKILPYVMYPIFGFVFLLSFFYSESDTSKEGQYISNSESRL
jgi:hypothetical protein